MTHELDPVIHPRRIAIVGASADVNKRGYRAVKALLDEGYLGTILPINPKETHVLGVPCHPTLVDAPGAIDLAVICTPASSVCGILGECGRKGVRAALLVAGGFSETGPEGAALEREVVATARRNRVRLIGPNTNGIYSARQRVNTLGIAGVPRGGMVMLSNSATIVLSLLTQAQKGAMGVHTMLSVGNQADIGFHEYLACFGEDPDAQVITSYVEGFTDLPSFVEAARRVASVKPIVMYVAGRTEQGRKAAMSHSGSLAGDYRVSTGLLAQAGVCLVSREDELYPVSEALSLFPAMRGRRVGVLSEGGGTITVAVEALVARGLEVPELSEQTLARIRSIVPNASAIGNPVDFGSGTYPTARICGDIARALLEDPDLDALLIVGFFGGYSIRYPDSDAGEAEREVCSELGRLSLVCGKPVIVQSLYAQFQPVALQVLRLGGVPVQRHIEIAAQCLAAAADYEEAKVRIAGDPGGARRRDPNPATLELIALCRGLGRHPVEPQTRDALAGFGFALRPHVVMRTAADAPDAVAALGDGPCALKIVSRDLPHKSDVGGVLLNVQGAAGMREGFERIIDRVSTHAPDAAIEGVLATPMARPGVEVIVGATRSGEYGPVVMFGLGGVFVEVIRDVVFKAMPLSARDAQEMLAQLRYPQMLDGVRGTAPVNRQALIELLLHVSDFMMAHADIAELDLNPIIANDVDCCIVDARMVLSATPASLPQ